MRIFILSDSHGNKEGIKTIFDKMSFDYLFFLGDGVGDIAPYIDRDDVYVVSGNCDFLTRVPNELKFEINGVKFFITHGNSYGVKYTLEPLIEKGISEDVDFVMFGHTHNQLIENIKGIYFINPGTFKRNISNQSCGLILDIQNDKVKITDLIVDFNKLKA